MIQSSQVDLTPIIESRQYLEKCVQEIEYLLQSSNIGSGNNNSAGPLNGQPENEQQLSVLQQQESLNTKFNQPPQQTKQKNVSPKQQQVPKHDTKPKNGNAPKRYSWVESGKIAGQLDTVRAITFIDSDHLVTGSDDGVVTEWKIKFDKKKTSAKTVETHRSHAGPIIGLCYDSVTNIIYSGGEDRSIRRWSPGQSMELGPFVAHQGFILSMAIDETTRSLATASSEGSIHIWDISNPLDLKAVAVMSYGSIVTLDEKEKQEFKLKATEEAGTDEEKDGDADYLDNDSGDEKKKLNFDSHNIPSATCIAFITGTQKVAVGYENSTIVLYDYKERVKIQEFRSLTFTTREYKTDKKKQEDGEAQVDAGQPVTSLAYSAKLNQLIASYDNKIRVFDINSGDCLEIWQAHSQTIFSIAMLESGESFMTSGADGNVNLWSFSSNGDTLSKTDKAKKSKKHASTRKDKGNDSTEDEGAGYWMLAKKFSVEQNFKTQEMAMPLVAYWSKSLETNGLQHGNQSARKPSEDPWSQGLVAGAGADGGVRLYMNCECEELESFT